jgi:hypothetical protein
MSLEVVLRLFIPSLCSGLLLLPLPCLQMQKLLQGFPAKGHAYSYYFMTVVPAYLLGLLVYGTAVWTS